MRPLTWRLWRWLGRPPHDSPIYVRALGQRGPSLPWYMGCAEIIGFVLIAPMLLLMGPVYGLAWTVGISSNLAAARSRGEYDLLALTPGGPLTVAWAMARATLDRNNTFGNANARNTWAGRLMVILLVDFVAYIAPRSRAGERIDIILLELAAIVVFIIIDHVQAIVFAVLLGMLAPTVVSNRGSAQTAAFAGYIGIQLGSYLALFVVTAAITRLLAPVGLPVFPGAALAIFGGLALFAGMREWLLRGLWHALVTRLNADAVLDRKGTDGV